MKTRIIKGMAVILTICLLFSSCKPLGSGIEGLVSPPDLIVKQDEIIEALQIKTSKDIALKYPKRGNNKSPFLVSDLNSDGVQEILVFYVPKSTSGLTGDEIIQMASLYVKKDKWICEETVSIGATSIDKVEISNFSSSGTLSLFLGVSSGNSKNRTLKMYGFSKGIKEVFSVSYDEFEIIDFGHNISDLLMVVSTEADLSDSGKKASIYDFSDNKLSLVDSIEIEAAATDFRSIKSAVFPDFSVVIYADSIIGDTMVTDVFKIQNRKIKKLFTDRFKRTAMVSSMDIDSDGYIEIPKDADFIKPNPTLDEDGNPINVLNILPPVNWYSIGGEKMSEEMQTIVNLNFGYRLRVPDNMRNKTVAIQSNQGSLLSVCFYSDDIKDSSNEIFSIVAHSKSSFDDGQSAEGYVKLAENNTYVYYVKINNRVAGYDSSYHVTYDQVIQAFAFI